LETKTGQSVQTGRYLRRNDVFANDGVAWP
jgi:hypothetical protein